MIRARCALATVLAATACGADAVPNTGGDAASGNDAHRAIDAAASPCGTCPGGYTCGAANGMPVCRASSGVPLFEHVFVIVMENTSKSTLDSATGTPFLQGLGMTAATLADFHGVAHPSLPNYIAMTSGDTQGISCDCAPDTSSSCNAFNCGTLLSSCGCEVQAHNLADDLEAAGRTWRSYAENAATPCNAVSATPYATKHVPFLYYDDIQSDAPRCMDHIVDYGQLAQDLASASTTRNFTFIVPNLTNDMHDPVPAGAQNLTNGDMWLAQEVPKILASPAYADHGILFIVWDEDDLSGLFAPDDPIPFFALSPLAKTAYTSSGRGDHYAFLATIEDALAIPRLGNAIAATPFTDLFPSN